MPGSEQLVLQPRDLQLLREIAIVRVVDREMARALGGFTSVTRINTRLLRLTRARLLVRRAAGTARGGHKWLYALSPRAAQRIEVPYRAPMWNPHATLAWSPALEHQLALGRVYLEFKAPVAPVRLLRWSTFHTPLSAHARLIPDALAEVESDTYARRAIFLEVDRGTERLAIWKRKAAAYVAFATSGEFSRRWPHAQFRVGVVAPSARRLESIRAAVAAATDKLFWFHVVGSQDVPWVWDHAWLRPRGNDRHSLI